MSTGFPISRKIIHIDMDAFFASVEQRDNKAYRGKPLIVGGKPGGRGVVAACSYEARAFGVHSAMPSSKAATLCPEAIFVYPRLSHYREVSSEIMEIFGEITSLVEPLSLDEAFLDVTVNSLGERSATRVAQLLRKKILANTGLTASAGVSYNKFIAKIASDINKPNGITVVTPQEAAEFIAALPIGRFFGVGKVTEEKMRKFGIQTGADLLSWDLADLNHHFGKIGKFLFNIARGIDDREVQPHRERKSIGNETTFANDVSTESEIISILTKLCERVGKTLEEKKTGGQCLTLKVRFSDFTTITRSLTQRAPIRNGREIYALLPRLLAVVDFSDKAIRLLGVTVSKLEKDKRPRQLMLPYMEIHTEKIPLQLFTQNQ